MAIPNEALKLGQKLLDHLLSDKEMMAGVRLRFSDLYRELEAPKDPSPVLSFSWATSNSEETISLDE